MAATSQAGVAPPCAISSAGSKSDQKLAAIITPEAKPSMALSTRLLIVLKKNTSPAPSAVTPHVNSVAMSACSAGASRPKPSNIALAPDYIYFLYFIISPAAV